MTSGSERIRKLAVLALIVGLVAQSAVAPAIAAPDDSSTEDCSGEFAFSILVGGSFQNNIPESCWSRVSTNATVTDIYQGALRDKDSQNGFVTTYSNLATSSLTYLRAHAKAQSVEGLRNGTSVPNVTDNVNASVDDKISQLQLNFIKAHNSTIRSNIYGIAAEENDSVDVRLAENQESYVEAKAFNGTATQLVYTENSSVGNSNTHYYKLNTTTVTLANGTSVSAQVIEVWYTGNDGSSKSDDEVSHIASPYHDWGENVTAYVDGYHVASSDPSQFPAGNQNRYLTFHASDQEANGGDLTTGTSEENVSAKFVYDQVAWHDEWDRLNSTSDLITTDVQTYVEGLNSTYTTEQLLNISVLDGVTLVQEYNTNRNTTGYNGWAAAELSLLGIDHNGTNAFSIEYTRRNASGVLVNETTTLSGTMLTNWEPSKTNGSFVVNTTYDTSNASGPVFFANQTTSNESTMLMLDGEFVITEMTNTQTGESINQTSVQGSNITQTWNVSLTEEEFKRLLNQRDNYSTYYDGAGGGGGGGGDFNFNFGAAGFGFIVIAGGGLILLSNSIGS